MKFMWSGFLLFILIIISVQNAEQRQTNMELKMQHDDSCVVVPSKKRSELQQFASWFHQDWKLIFPDFYQGAKIYINSISSERKKALKQELQEFLDKYNGSISSEVKKAWLGLGAQAWQSDLDILKTLHNFVKLMEA